MAIVLSLRLKGKELGTEAAEAAGAGGGAGAGEPSAVPSVVVVAWEAVVVVVAWL